MDNELEVIRDEMEQTRANLAEKLGALETQVRETVSGATEAVSSTVDGVKGVVSSVSETVETVTDTFNVAKHVERHPWLSVGAAMATGFVIAQVVGRMGSQPAPVYVPPSSSTHPQPTNGSAPAATGAPRSAEVRTDHRPEPAAEPTQESGLMHSIESMLPDMKPVVNTVVSSLGGLAVGGLMGLIREMASHGLPKEWQGDATKLIDQVTNQLGGKPLDTAKSGQLFDVLGLGDFMKGLFGQGGQQDGAGSQQGAQGGSPTSFTGNRGTPGTGRPPGQRL